MNSDPGAHPNKRWGRCPGFRNRKKRYMSAVGGYPLAKLIWVDWRASAHVSRIDELYQDIKPKRLSPQPFLGVCKKKNIKRSDYNKNNESETDFAYILALLNRGFKTDEIINKILIERTNWKNHQSKKRKRHYLPFSK